MSMMFRDKVRNIAMVAAVLTTALGGVLMSGKVALAADWPMYRHDVARSGITPEKLDLPLSLQWVHQPRHAPAPAWPDPEFELHRTPFDYAYQVSAANGLLYFGSSADNKVYALDATTGKERWSFFTGGPVRFAPAVWKDRVLATSDDGWLYCLSAADGKVIWKFRGGPSDARLLGNERMMSRWPLRSSVAIDKGIIHLIAGMWPAEGVYIYALRVSDGKVLYKTGGKGIRAAQGELLLLEDRIVVPAGRGCPTVLHRKTGTYYGMTTWDHAWAIGNTGPGIGTWGAAFDKLIFSEYRLKGTDYPAAIGKPREGQPNPGDGLVAWNARSGAPARGRQRFLLPGDFRAIVAGETVYATGSGEVTAYDLKGLLANKVPTQCVKWRVPCDCRYALILAGETLFVGGKDKVVAVNAAKGDIVWTGTVRGKARGLAVADGQLFVSTDTGEIACFSTGKVSKPARISPPPANKSPYRRDKLTPVYAELAERIIKETGVKRGYCLDLGAGDGRLAFELAKRTELKIYCLEPDADKVAAARKALDAAGLYGVRVTVDQGSLSSLPYAGRFANLIVSGTGIGADLQDVSAEELYRVLRPCGGVVYLTPPVEKKSGSARGIENWLRKAGIPKKEIQNSGRAAYVVRGPLPGSGDWTHAWADAGRTSCSQDRLLKWPLELQWFGKPGPARLISRHMYTAGPVSTNGRVFQPGEHHILAFDIHNGHELWRQDLPWVERKFTANSSLAADADNLYVVIGDVCLALDARTGRQKQMYGFPIKTERFVLDKPRTFKLELDSKHSGTVTMRKTKDALELKLVTADPIVTKEDTWELGFDFRPADQRGGLYGPGAFQVIVVPVVPATETRPPAVSVPCAEPPKIDGTLDDACWDGAEPLVIIDSKTHTADARCSGFLRHDKDNLYVALRCAAAQKAGKPLPWKAKTKGEDALVNEDDSWQLFLSDKRNQMAVRLGVAASGARYDGIFQQRCGITMNVKWNGKWTSAVSIGAEAWTSEMAIPWETLKAVGLDTDQLTVNVKGVLFDANGRKRTAELRFSFYPLIIEKRSKDVQNAVPVQFFPVSFTATPKAWKQPASWKPGLGPKHPDLTVTGALVETGSETIVRLPWDEVEKLIGSRPKEFTFGITLNFSDGGHGPYVRHFRRFRLSAHDAYTRHKFLNPRAPSLTRGWATIVLDPAAAPPPPPPAAVSSKQHDSILREIAGLPVGSKPWGYLSCYGDVVIGSNRTDVFAFDKETGLLRWFYRAKKSVPHIGIVIDSNRLFLLDSGALVALDVKTGRELWKTSEKLGRSRALRAANNKVVAIGKGGLSAYAGADGAFLWHQEPLAQTPRIYHIYGKPPLFVYEWMVVVGETFYAWPYAYDLSTGELKMRRHPLTDEENPWVIPWKPHVRIAGCLTGLLVDVVNRDALSFHDLAIDGTQFFRGIAGWDSFSAIIASGLLLHPPACPTCTCKYAYDTTVALAPMSAGQSGVKRKRHDNWMLVYGGEPGTGRIRRLRLNIGAPGDRCDDAGNPWLRFPKPSSPAMNVKGAINAPQQYSGQPEYFQRDAESPLIEGATRPWIYTSGCRAIGSLSVQTDLGGRVTSLPCAQSPKVDGKLDDACWNGKSPVDLIARRRVSVRPEVLVRHGADALYLAFRQKRSGQSAWTLTTRGHDAPVWNDDAWEVFLSDSTNAAGIHLGVSASGARFDSKFAYGKNKTDDAKWNGSWNSAVSVEKDAWTLELAIPWKTLADAGLEKEKLEMNIRGMNRQIARGETREFFLKHPGRRGWEPCESFVPVSLDKVTSVGQKPYTVRLHFIEPDDAKPGQRVFDVKIQGKIVLKNLDVVKEAGGPNRGLVREFKNISVNDELKIEFVPGDGKKITASTAPVLCGLEVVQQDR